MYALFCSVWHPAHLEQYLSIVGTQAVSTGKKEGGKEERKEGMEEGRKAGRMDGRKAGKEAD